MPSIVRHRHHHLGGGAGLLHSEHAVGAQPALMTQTLHNHSGLAE